jgi:uncharacterized protein YggE
MGFSRRSIGRLTVIGLVCLLFSLTVQAEEERDTLSVRGEATLMVVPDQVMVSIGVVSEHAQAKKALAANSRSMQQVINRLLKLGISKKEYSTHQLSVQPIWSSRPRNADSQWRSQITGYRVNNTLQVTTKKLDLVGDIINEAASAGANQVQSIRFGLANPRQYRSQAISQAVENAREDADVAAKASGVKIKRVNTMHIDYVPSVTPVEKSRVMRSSLAEAAPVPPVNPGDVSVRASVSIVYELEQ